MVHGKNNKRRGKVPVTRKQKDLRKLSKIRIKDTELRKVWNKQLTVNQNYKNLGILKDANKNVENHDNKMIETHLFDVPDSDIFDKKKKHVQISDEEIKVLRLLKEKHGDNYENMARDIKINIMQLSAGMIQKRIARMQLVEANIIKTPSV